MRSASVFVIMPEVACQEDVVQDMTCLLCFLFAELVMIYLIVAMHMLHCLILKTYDYLCQIGKELWLYTVI